MRKLLLPVLIGGAIGIPFLISQDAQREQPSPSPNQSQFAQSNYSVPAYPASTGYTQSPFHQGLPGGPNAPAPYSAVQTVPAQSQTWNARSPVPSHLSGHSNLVLPGNAHGPDLSSVPMEFMPTGNLNEIIRFDIRPDWVKQRWPRVSMTSSDSGLHGMRVALVTGTNRSDLHGSLTYHFDRNQSLQRISFQGWTGEPSRLIQLLTQAYKFQQKPTHLAGLYVASDWGTPKSAMLMQHPSVIRAENPTQQVGVMLEINNPQGKFGLSNNLRGMLSSASKQ